MLSADLWPLAQQGNPQALETVFKMQNPKPSWVIKVRLYDNCLQVLLEAEPTPDQQRAVALVRSFLAQLQPLTITTAQTVRIWGRRRGQLLADWVENISLAPYLQLPVQPPEATEPAPGAEQVTASADERELGHQESELEEEPKSEASTSAIAPEAITTNLIDQHLIDQPASADALTGVPELEGPALAPEGSVEQPLDISDREPQQPEEELGGGTETLGIEDLETGQKPEIPTLTLAGPTEESLTEERPIDKDLAGEGPLDEDLAGEGPLDEGLIDEGPLDEDLAGEGPLDEGLIDEGPLDEDLAGEGLIDEGLIDEGLIDEGLIDEGLIDEGLIDEGLIDEGLIDEGLVDESGGDRADDDLTAALLAEPGEEGGIAEEAALATQEPVRVNRLADLTAAPANLSGAAALTGLMAQRTLEAVSDIVDDRALDTQTREPEAITADWASAQPSEDRTLEPAGGEPEPLAQDLSKPVSEDTADRLTTGFSPQTGDRTEAMELEGQALEMQSILEASAGGRSTDDWERKRQELTPTLTSEPTLETPLATQPQLAEASSATEDATGVAEEEEAEWLLRPEIVIVVLFALLIIIWQTYAALLKEVGDSDSSLSSSGLARRLKTTRRTINRLKKQPDFPQWSQSRDPDRIAWVYGENGRFTPVLTTTSPPADTSPE